MDICVCKSEIKTEFPDSSTSGHEENNSVHTAGPDIKSFVKTETCDYEYHDLMESEPDTSNHVKQTVNDEDKMKIEAESLKYQSSNYDSELQDAWNEISTDNLVNEMEIKEERLFHIQESLDIEKEEKAEPEIEKPLNFDLSNEEIPRLFTCEVYDAAFSWKSNLRRHVLYHRNPHKKSIYRCELCNKGFIKFNSIKSHVIFHLKTKDNICEKCHKGFTRKCDLNKHMQAAHLGIKYTCEKCDKQFTTKDSLDRHLKNVHLKIKTYICEKCHKQFAGKSYLNIHMKAVHLKTKDYICEQCDKQFTQKCHLNFHVKSVHLKTKDHVCEKCNKQFAQKSGLNKHMQSVHLDIKYTCEKCDKQFTQKVSLNKHMNTVHLNSNPS